MDPNVYDNGVMIGGTIVNNTTAVVESTIANTTSNDRDDTNNSLCLYRIQIITGSISCLASLILAISIQCSIKRSRSTPYRRLVYGLCLSDILQSLAVITGPFATPTGTPGGLWSRGTVATCNLNGFMLSAGFTAVTMYFLSLSIYYICRLQRKMSNGRFRIRLEGKIHRFIWIWHLVLNISLALSHNFNAKWGGGLCFVTEYPQFCDVAPEKYGECQRGRHAKLLLTIFIFVPWCVCLFGIVYCMLRLVHHAFVLSRVTLWHGRRMETDDTISSTSVGASHRDGISISASCGQSSDRGLLRESSAATESSGDKLVKLSLLYKRELTTQAMSFIGVFFFVYLMPIVRYIHNLKKIPFPFALMALYSFCFPLGGLLNILVHTRPHIAALRRKREKVGMQISWIRAFVRVLLSGGDTLDLKDDDWRDEQQLDQSQSDEGCEDNDHSHCEDCSNDNEEISSRALPSAFMPGFSPILGEDPSSILSSSFEKDKNILHDYSDGIHGKSSHRGDLLFPVQRLEVQEEEDDFVRKFKSKVKGDTPWS